MKIAIRMDDIAPGMDWEKFDRFRALCTRYNVKPLIGVVPDNRDPSLNVCPPRADFFDVVKALRAEGWSIAMHGCHHVYTSKSGGLFPLNHLSEFAGLSYEKQSELIRRGRQVLTANGIATDIFMAPAHSYDRNTIRALKENGFARITDGFGKQPYLWDGMTFYPISFRKKDSLRGGEGITTLVVHANTMSDNEFDNYEKIFSSQQMISFLDYLNTPAEPRSGFGRMKEKLMADMKRRAVEKMSQGSPSK
ncbi:MAG: DUF2334 domain-containing protein [Lachnospiraceae bacterium]|nr:DUF2334 domain-containing protein [Lachnospiraceae bacterium]